MNAFVVTVHILVSVFLIAVVLLQAGKGASIGASFGGSNQTLFGSSQGSFVGKATAAAAVVFMLTSLTLAYFSTSSSRSTIMEDMAPAAVSSTALPDTLPGAEKAKSVEEVSD